MAKPIISADSHITEPPDTYTARIDAALPATARRTSCAIRSAATSSSSRASTKPIPMGLVAAAGKRAEELTDVRRPVRGPPSRAAGIPTRGSADQDRDGVAAEILYPTVGMMLCNHPDFDYKHACFDAYNRWIAEYCVRASGPAARHRADRDALGRRRHPRPASASRRSACAA